MLYQINLAPDERVLADIDFQVIQQFFVSAPSLRLVVTNAALLVPSTKFALGGDARCFKRVPKGDIKQVRVQAAPPFGAWAFAAFMAFAALFVLSGLFMDGDVHWSKGMAFGVTLLLGAVLLAASAKKRHRLVIRWQKGAFLWNPPFVIDSVSKKQINEVLDVIVRSAAEAQMPVRDERAGTQAAVPTASV